MAAVKYNIFVVQYMSTGSFLTLKKHSMQQSGVFY